MDRHPLGTRTFDIIAACLRETAREDDDVASDMEEMEDTVDNLLLSIDEISAHAAGLLLPCMDKAGMEADKGLLEAGIVYDSAKWVMDIYPAVMERAAARLDSEGGRVAEIAAAVNGAEGAYGKRRRDAVHIHLAVQAASMTLEARQHDHGGKNILGSDETTDDAREIYAERYAIARQYLWPFVELPGLKAAFEGSMRNMERALDEIDAESARGVFPALPARPSPSAN